MDTQTVEMGEMRLACRGEATLLANGLGACVGLCLYDAALRLAALVHIVLPTAPTLPGCPALFLPPAQCAHTAVPHVLEALEREGASLSRLQAAIVGGAQIFSHAAGNGQPSRLELGARSAAAVREGLDAHGVSLAAQDIGGHFGRNLRLDARTGDVWVRRIGGEERLLVQLGTAVPSKKVSLGVAA